MGEDERVRDFESWSKTRGNVAGGPDLRRVANELLGLAGTGLIQQSHIDGLLKKYRDGLMGARFTLVAQRVGEEIIVWQRVRKGLSVPPAREIGLELDEPPPDSLERPFAGKRGLIEEIASRPASVAPTRSLSPYPPFGNKGKSSFPPLGSDSAPPPRMPPRSLSIPALGSVGPPISIQPPNPLEETDASWSARPPPRRAVDELDNLGGVSYEPDDNEQPLFPKKFSDRPPPSEPPLVPLSSRPPPPGPLDSVPPTGLTDPPLMSGRSTGLSHAPRNSGRSPKTNESISPKSIRPLADEPSGGGIKLAELDIDSSPNSARSRPPPARANVKSKLDVEMTSQGVVPGRGKNRSDEVTESVAPPAPSAAPPDIGEGVEPEPTVSRRNLIRAGIGGAVVLALGAFILTRPSCSPFTKTDAPVSGAFTSKHLGVSLDFGGNWKHDQTKDDEATVEGWRRRVSTFYKGQSVTDFSSSLTLVTFFKKDASATNNDAAQLGANETLSLTLNKRCGPFKHPNGGEGTFCSSLFMRSAQRFATIEAYFPLAGRVVFARFLLDMPLLGAPGPAGPSRIDANPNQSQPGFGDADEQLIYDRIEDAQKVLTSIRPLESK